MALFCIEATPGVPSGAGAPRIEDVNPAFALHVGVPSDCPEPDITARAAAAMDPNWLDIVRLASQSGEPTVAEQEVSLHGRVFILRAIRYAPEHVALYLSDITEQKKLEERVQAAQRLENIGLLVSGITHDLNNLLTPGWMAASMLRRRHQDPDDLKLIALLEDSSKSASEMVRHIMSSVRESKTAIAALYPAQAVKELVQVLKVTLPTNIRIETTLAKHLAPAAIDQAHFNQVVLNLAINARDAMPDGGTLTLGAEEMEFEGPAPLEVPSPGRYILFRIADSGVGIHPDNLAHVFEPFFTTKGPGKGTGLGLPRVRELVEKHGGAVCLSSTLGQGTEFRLYLPALHGDAAEQVRELVGEEVLPTGADQVVMIVDDYEGLREILSLMLKANGFSTITAADGHEALKQLRQMDEKPDLLLVDLAMPRTNGEELVRQLRAAQDNTPVIVMTALGPGDELSAVEARLNALGVQAVLRKPLREPVLLNAIATALSAVE